MGFEVSQDDYETAIGHLVLEYISNLRPYELPPVGESDALRTLFKIREILDTDDLGDPECFHRIDEIVKELDKIGVYTRRHDS